MISFLHLFTTNVMTFFLKFDIIKVTKGDKYEFNSK